MAKMTLLEIVQNILSAMDSDFVNSIGDSVEADQIAEVVKETYFDIVNNVLDLPEHHEVISLTALGDTSHPNYLQIPDDVRQIDYIKYDKHDSSDTDLQYSELMYLEPKEFARRSHGRNESDNDVTKISDFNVGDFLIKTDKHPEWWTSFDDKYVMFDSYLSTEENTIQSSKVFAYGMKEPSWTESDTFTPDLDSELFPLLLEEAKATCFVNFKQVSNQKAEQKARRQLTSQHNKLHKTKVENHGRQPNYGRPVR